MTTKRFLNQAQTVHRAREWQAHFTDTNGAKSVIPVSWGDMEHQGWTPVHGKKTLTRQAVNFETMEDLLEFARREVQWVAVANRPRDKAKMSEHTQLLKVAVSPASPVETVHELYSNGKPRTWFRIWGEVLEVVPRVY